MTGETISAHHPVRFWHETPDGRLQCDVCPRACRLKDGQRGFCFVRARSGATMVLDTWGRSSGFCVDPIEKKPLHHFLPGTPILSFGTAGCNMGCVFCQNADISKAREMDRLNDRALPEAIAAAAAELNCRSVAYTYNDPVVFLEYAADTATLCRQRGIKNVAVTAGYVMGEARAALFAEMDAANVDLKAFTEDFYHHRCAAGLEAVKDTLVWLARETKVWVEITTLLIPGENDSPAEIEAMAGWIADTLGSEVPLHLSAFHPAWKMTDRPPTPPATLTRCRQVARQAGLRHVYTGNVHDPEGGSTECPNCGARLIGRDRYVITDWGLGADGCCARCGTRLAGLFEAGPGTWGAKRLPVRLG